MQAGSDELPDSGQEDASRGGGFLANLERIALASEERTARAHRAADLIRREGRFSRVELYDVKPTGATLLAASDDGGASSVHLYVSVPITLFAGDLVGQIEVHADRDLPLDALDRMNLKACAGVLWWLWV